MLKVMRARYESLAVHDLKEIAKARGIKGVSSMKKADVVEAMLALDAAEGARKPEEGPKAGTEKETQAEKETRVEKETQTEKETQVGKETQAEKKAPEADRPESKSQDARGRVGKPREGARQQGPNHTKQRERVRENVRERPAQSAGGKEQTAQGSSVREQAAAYSGAHQASQNPEGGKVVMSRSQEPRYYSPYNKGTAPSTNEEEDKFPVELDSGITVSGILEVMADGYGFIRSANYLPGENDIYVAPSQIRRFGLKTGDILEGNTRIRTQNEKFSALLYVKSINGYAPEVACRRLNFEDMTPIFPDSRLKLEKYGSSVAMRIMDLLSPIGKGQRGMIVSPPKAGKTTLLKEVAMSVKHNYPDMHLIILLIDERPEEVTDMRETVEGPNVEVIYSTFDELPDHHKRVAEMVVERARRLVEHKQDVMILLDSITRLARAYNLVVQPSGRTLSGGIDPAALHMPKRFFGAARNMREGGSLTILATALVDTGSKMDDVIYEEFKGTGNMELVLDRKLSERRVFPAIDIPKTSTRREDLLLTHEEMEAINIVRRALNVMKSDEAADRVLDLFAKTRNNAEFVQSVKKMRFI